MTRHLHPSRLSAVYRVLTGVAIGVLIALLIPNVEPWAARILCGWIGFTLTLAILIAPLWRADADLTARVFALLTATVSLLGAGIVLHEANTRNGSGSTALVILALGVVVVSWLVLHLEYTLHYAHRYYADGGGVTFPAEGDGTPEPPDFRDFAYLSFTLGMTFQVSDNNVTTRRMRRLVLGHCLLSYLFSAVIIAVTINAVASFVR